MVLFMKGKNEHKSENVFSTEKTLLERIEEVVESGRHSGNPSIAKKLKLY